MTDTADKQIIVSNSPTTDLGGSPAEDLGELGWRIPELGGVEANRDDVLLVRKGQLLQRARGGEVCAARAGRGSMGTV